MPLKGLGKGLGRARPMFANTKNEWKSVVKRIYGRKIFVNYEKSVNIFQELGYDRFYKNATVLDCYPSAGVFSAALYNTIHPEKHVFLEPFKSFNKFLNQQGGLNTLVTDMDPFRWDTFNILEREGRYKIEKQPFSQVHNQTLFMANLTHPQGEQLCAQYLNCINNRSWIMRYGRIRLLVWLRASTAEKLLAGAGEQFRNRIGVQRESCCDARVVLHQYEPPTRRLELPYPKLLQHTMYPLDPEDMEMGKRTKALTLIELTPKEEQVEHMDEFEYVNRCLFQVRGTPLKLALNNLGHGAIEHLGPKLDPGLLEKNPMELTLDELLRITQVFWEWPFKPTFLHDFYEESFMGNGNSEEV